jgi:putative ABC transport system ATP-binding protein
VTAETRHQVAVRCQRLVKMYAAPTGETQALRGVEAAFRSGTVSAITGPSGSGKSSLLSILALRERQTGGDLELDGVSTSRLSLRALVALRRDRVSWVPQRSADALLPTLSAREQLVHTAALRGRGSLDVDDLLERIGLASRRRALPHELAGGEQQRLAVAAAVLAGTAVLVADEPTAELDDESARVVLAELRNCAAAGSCVVISTHDDRAMRAADRTLALRHGVLATESAGIGRALAAIDSSGRLQLPPTALDLFPDGRAAVEIVDGEVRLRPPGDENAAGEES